MPLKLKIVEWRLGIDFSLRYVKWFLFFFSKIFLRKRSDRMVKFKIKLKFNNPIWNYIKVFMDSIEIN